MIQKIYLVTLLCTLYALGGIAQDLHGWINLQQDSTKPLYETLVKNKDQINEYALQDSSSRVDSPFTNILLAAFVVAYQNGQKADGSPTDHQGRFTIKSLPKGTYTFKLFNFMQQGYQLKTTVIDPQNQILEIRINAPIFAARFLALQLKDVPYNRSKARQDIANGVIQVVELSSNLGDWLLPDKYIKNVEKKYGFKRVIKYYEVGQLYLDQAQKAYNTEMYAYLDKKYRINSRKVIWKAFRASYRQFMIDVKKENEARRK